LDKEIKRAEREQAHLSLLMLDLDYFKEYNDTYGHPEGDKLLVEFGSVLKDAVRDSDIAARYGGDEFVIILPHTDEKGAIQLSARVAERVGRHPFPGYEKMPGGRMSVSVGCATYPSPAKNKIELVKLADDQMYKTKEVRRAVRKFSSQ
jgi:diguanylate cyclase (GGDEF)-like protein